MATFALIANGVVVNSVNADNEADLGDYRLIYDVKNVTAVDPQPSRGWVVSGDTFIPPRVFGAATNLWNGVGFDAPTVKDAPIEDEKGK